LLLAGVIELARVALSSLSPDKSPLVWPSEPVEELTLGNYC
jgi:hypothetical protein